ncbi:uncharacterized protein N7483_002840 [Penicillium malachiteum]|uniref:uncharacterized protein n=1 Tax=Penicillium malachiteum TaxID=1324776 RepID=UPI002548ABD6|nr:uncharacterized protein N7483_002840 [Penicillium malachiteum]KAJ5737715.1 hypothetical protein N7483_002840 [Penicillium malachiteum]
MENHPESHLLFPFNIVSQIWQRIWYGLLCFHQPDESSPPSSPRPARFPLTPTPCSSSDKSDKTRNSSPSFRRFSYTEITSLLGVDFLRGAINKDGVSQNGKRHSLHVSNPDIYAHTSRTESPPDSIYGNLRLRRMSSPALLRSPFTLTPYPLITASVGLDPEELLSSSTLFAEITGENVIDGEPSLSTTEENLWDYLERCRLRPLPLFTQSRLSRRNGLTRALGLFMPSDAPPSTTDEPEMESSTDDTEIHRSNAPDPIPPAQQSRRTSISTSRRPSGIIHAVGSMFKRRFSQVDDETATPSTPSSSTPPPSYSANTSPLSRSTEWCTPASRWGRAMGTSSNRSPSSGWSFMPQYPGRRSPIYGSELDYLEISLAAGLAAQERRKTKEGE